jgi:hypothetical protein
MPDQVTSVQEARGPSAVRDATEADRQALSGLHRLWYTHDEPDPPPTQDWLDSHDGVTRVALDAGAVVAASRVLHVDRTQCWLEGIAVRTDHHDASTAGLMLRDAVNLARSDRMLTLRYATETLDETVHQMSLDLDLRPRGTWLDFKKTMDAAACSVARSKSELGSTTTIRLNPPDRPRVISLLHTGGRPLYVDGWVWRALDDATLAVLIEEGRAFFSRSGVGGWGLAVLGRRTSDSLEATIFGKDAACAQSLLEHLRTLACESMEGITLTLHATQDTPAAVLLASTARRGEWRPVSEHPVRVWEISLT